MKDRNVTDTPARLPSYEAELNSRLVSSTGGASAAWRVRCYHELSSTMDAARRLISEENDSAPAVILCKHQLKGRGRLGSEWVSTAGSLFATFVFHCACPVNALSGLSLMAGCSISRALRSAGCELFLKWPNDLMSKEGLKCGGVMVEVLSEEGQNFVLIGVGLNLQEPPSDVKGSGSLAMIARKIFDPPEAAALIAPALFCDWLSFGTAGFAKYRDEWHSYALFISQEASVDTGKEVLRGIFMGVDASGAAVLKIGGRDIAVAAGQFRAILDL